MQIEDVSTLLYSDQDIKLVGEVRGHRVYVHADFVKFSHTVVKRVLPLLVELESQLGSHIYTYPSTEKGVRLCQLAGFVPTGSDVSAWWDSSILLPEYQLWDMQQ